MSSAFNPYASQSRRPQTFLDYSFAIDRLDGGLGYVLTQQLAGEFSIGRRVSVGARIPFLTIREQFLPQTDNIGDIAVSGKILAGDWSRSRLFMTLGSEISFPTGDEKKGTGTGDVVLSPFATLSKGFKHVGLVTTLGTTIAIANQVRPSLDYALTAIVTLAEGALPVDFFLAFQGSTAISSETFTSGSSKAYLRPAFAFHLTPKLLSSLGAKVSVLDTLELKPGAPLSKASTAPLSDVQAGFVFDINYSF